MAAFLLPKPIEEVHRQDAPLPVGSMRHYSAVFSHCPGDSPLLIRKARARAAALP